MIRNVSTASEIFLADLQRIQNRGAQLSEQISSGVRVSRASDDPDSISNILQLRARIDGNDQMEKNLQRAQAEADSADQALSESIQAMDRITTLAAQAANSTTTADQRTTIAQEVRGLGEQLVAFSRTAVEGRYIFSGDDETQPPYAVDDTGASLAIQTGGAASTRRIAGPNGVMFEVSQTAADIFDHKNTDGTAADDNVFDAVQSLYTALSTNDQAGIDAALPRIRASAARLNQSEGFYGAVQNRLSSSLTTVNQDQVSSKALLSQEQDTDMTAAILESSAVNTQEQAALAAKARPTMSLFDFLK